MAKHVLSLPLLVVLCSGLLCGAKDDNVLSLAVFLSLSSSDINGTAFLPSLDIALELVNNRTDLLPGFTVEANISDSAVSTSKYNYAACMYFCSLPN